MEGAWNYLAFYVRWQHAFSGFEFFVLKVVCDKKIILNPYPAECIFHHLIIIFHHLELLTQFPASNNEKYYYLWKIDMSKIKLLDQLSIY